MSLHTDLLAQAIHLANREPKKPRQASLRRAVSTAYYALFHLLVSEATARLVTGQNRTPLRHALGRAFVHAAMKEAAQGFANYSPSPKLGAALAGKPVQPELSAVAAAFCDLQQARHEADYDVGRRFAKTECLDLVDQARNAFSAWKAVRNSIQADVFLVGLLSQRQMRS